MTTTPDAMSRKKAAVVSVIINAGGLALAGGVSMVQVSAQVLPQDVASAYLAGYAAIVWSMLGVAALAMLYALDS
jgi:hypothetical protein